MCEMLLNLLRIRMGHKVDTQLVHYFPIHHCFCSVSHKHICSYWSWREGRSHSQLTFHRWHTDTHTRWQPFTTTCNLVSPVNLTTRKPEHSRENMQIQEGSSWVAMYGFCHIEHTVLKHIEGLLIPHLIDLGGHFNQIYQVCKTWSLHKTQSQKIYLTDVPNVFIDLSIQYSPTAE